MNFRQKFLGDVFRSLTGVATAFAILLFLAPSANAAVVYSQTPTPNALFFGEAPIGTCCFTADDFVLTSAAIITKVTWRGAMAPVGTPAPVDDFTINFYNDNGAGTAPGALIDSFNVGNVARVDTGETIIDGAGTAQPLLEHTASLGAGIALAAGTTYWISIFNNTADDVMAGTPQWLWAADASATVASGIRQSVDVGATWTLGPRSGTPVFTLFVAGISS